MEEKNNQESLGQLTLTQNIIHKQDVKTHLMLKMGQGH